jgi:hypothetical protein
MKFLHFMKFHEIRFRQGRLGCNVHFHLRFFDRTHSGCALTGFLVRLRLEIKFPVSLLPEINVNNKVSFSTVVLKLVGSGPEFTLIHPVFSSGRSKTLHQNITYYWPNNYSCFPSTEALTF